MRRKTSVIFLLVENRLSQALVIGDDTDLCITVPLCIKSDITGQAYMDTLKKERSLVDIKAFLTKHKDIMPDLLAMHALTGCDTVDPYHGIDKAGCSSCAPFRQISPLSH